MNEIKIGTYDGDGAAQNISIGFIPGAVLIANVEDGDHVALWFNGMADASMVSIVAAAGPVLDTTNGVSDYAGSTTTTPGFTVGTDLSESGKTYRYIAFRGGAGAQA